jgi:hypothetical protein
MKPEQAKRWITDSRLDPYLAEVGGDHERAIALYVWNASVSAAMFETLHHVEVAVRNTIDAQFEPVLASAEPPAMWLCDPGILNERSLQLVEETIARIRQERHMPTRGRVVAGLTFGFWRALFDKRYDRLWVSHLHKAFPHGSGDRAQIAGLMTRLGPFRNRVAHHETIIRTPLANRHEDMLMLVETIDPEAREWIESVSSIAPLLEGRP